MQRFARGDRAQPRQVVARPFRLLQVRGANYLNDKKKVEVEGLEAELLNVDLVELEEKFWNIAEVLPAVTNSTAPFMFIMQARCPLRQQSL